MLSDVPQRGPLAAVVLAAAAGLPDDLALLVLIPKRRIIDDARHNVVERLGYTHGRLDERHKQLQRGEKRSVVNTRTEDDSMTPRAPR